MGQVKRLKSGAISRLMVLGFLFLPALGAQAAEVKIESKKISVTDHGKTYRFRLAYGMNANHQFQVVAYYLQDRGLYRKERPVFYGRDLDGDRYPETWFVRQDIFIYQVIRHNRTNFAHSADHGEDAIQHLIARIGGLKKENYLKELWMQFGNFATTTVSSLTQAKEEFVQNELDLTSLQMQINRRKDQLAPDEELPADLQNLQALVEQGYSENIKHLQKALNGDYTHDALVETALNVTLIKVGELVLRGGTWIAKSVGNIPRVTRAAESLEAFIERCKAKLKFGTKAQVVVDTAALSSTYRLSYQAVIAQTRVALQGLAERNALANQVLKALSAVKGVYYRGAVENFKYLLQTQSLQVLAEAYDKRAEIYDPNPIVMAKKLFSNEDFLQDFAFMCNESMLQGGIAAGPGSLKRRFMIAGAVSLFDSGVMNIAIKGEADLKRVGMDTGWEMIIGNAQTQLDVASLKYFQKLAIEQKNPKLKLVGYAIALVDQFVGYVGYSKASTAVNKGANPKTEKPEPQIKLVPILAEVEGH